MQDKTPIIERIKIALENCQNAHGLTVSGVYTVLLEDFQTHLDRRTLRKYLDHLNRLGIVAFEVHRVGPCQIPSLHYKIKK